MSGRIPYVESNLNPNGSLLSKSSGGTIDPTTLYCVNLSIQQTPAELELQENTVTKHDAWFMLGAPEVFHLGKTYIHLIGAKRCLDIGTFTGASALAWASALPDGEGSRVLTMDIDDLALKELGLPVLDKHPQQKRKIDFRLGLALEELDQLIAKGEAGTWDFAFIDADKMNYTEYYKRLMILLRPGGVILVDNALWSGRVLADPSGFDEETRGIHECNHYIHNDPASHSILLNIGDGAHVAVKK